MKEKIFTLLKEENEVYYKLCFEDAFEEGTCLYVFSYNFFLLILNSFLWT